MLGNPDVQRDRYLRKKLFEWDAEKHLLIMVERQKEYSCELAEDNTFICVVKGGAPCYGEAINMK